ncbi:MAG: hypothetical protein AAFR81_01975 [Chloroflexota bacterium]
MDFSTALASMCEECEIGLLAQVLRDIRLRMDVSLRDFAEHINAQNTAYEKKWLLDRGARLRNINKNIVHRWEGSETQAPSIPIDFGKAELQWIGTILGLSAQEQAQYDQAVLCYLLFDLDERARDICDDQNTLDTEPVSIGIGVAVMPEPLKDAGFSDVDLILWETATAYLNQPSPETEAAYLKARQQLEQRLIAETAVQTNNQANESAKRMNQPNAESKIKRMPNQRNRTWLLAGVAVFGFFMFMGGMLFNNYLVGQPFSDGDTTIPSDFALTATQIIENASQTAIVPATATTTQVMLITATPTRVVSRTPIPSFTPTATFTPTQLPPTVPPLITATPIPTSTP